MEGSPTVSEELIKLNATQPNFTEQKASHLLRMIKTRRIPDREQAITEATAALQKSNQLTPKC